MNSVHTHIDLPERHGTATHEGIDAPLPNAWYAPGFSPVSEFRRMLAVLRGHGGSLEQSFLYFDHHSAMDWCQIASQQDYADAHRSMPLERAALSIFRASLARPIDLIALGPGTGHLETRLLSHLAALLPYPTIRFYLLDISQPLLAEAYRHAAHALALFEGITPIAVLGDFHALPQYSQILYSVPSAPRCHVVCLLGGTFANLDHETRFVRDSLCAFPQGTLLLLDHPCPFAPPDQPDELRRADPWLAEGGPISPWRDRVLAFWSGPLRRYVPDCQAVDIHVELNPAASPIPGSYAVEARARVHVPSQPPRDFAVFRIKRHAPPALARALRDIGWDPLDGWPYGQDVGYPRALSLFRKR